MLLKQPDLSDLKIIQEFLDSYPNSNWWIAGTSSLNRYHENIDQWILTMQDWAKGHNLPKGRVPVIQWICLNLQGEMLGAINLRPQLNDYLLHSGGQIGYVVHPSYRRQGVATWMLGQVLKEASNLGIERILITCRSDNDASKATIEKWGGLLEDQRMEKGVWVKRYWIDLSEYAQFK
ncbi:GNAT family N-acetyltransferase [Facklamia miroungae]|uniref:Predicted acetyltransferase n=1 Tax=Facklamia miroungae TaxID=120956 RepID=A0A1G7QJL2_9LACT|nr:GNAT family N-acetyltransferase [Facklamia miroungae]NKZ28965.1 GNAT family N-acetyltransferase [Facklamia miroungae]SDF98703.1 Predicted acetyltransferase [Facklamia miroungae]